MEEKNRVAELVERTISGVDVTIESQKVVGEKIVNERGQTATVLNSVTVMTMSGGGEYGEIRPSVKQNEKFAGGSVTLKSIKPQFFILDNGKEFRVVNGFDPLFALINLLKDYGDGLKK